MSREYATQISQFSCSQSFQLDLAGATHSTMGARSAAKRFTQKDVPMKRTAVIVVLLLLLAACGRTADASEAVESLLDRLESDRGICVILGDPTCDQALHLAKQTEMLVYVQMADRNQVDAARRKAGAAGVGPNQLQIDNGDLAHLHLADNLADAVLVVGQPKAVPEKEVLRVLRPGGFALIGDRELVKPIPAGLDDWSHPYHGPDNNPLSQDETILAPYLTQFLADPRYGPAPQVAVCAGGRFFKAFGHVAWHEREEPLLNTLVAFNGYNGTVLWKRPLPEGLMVHRNTIIATPDVLFLGDDKSCKVLDAATGELCDEIKPPIDVAGGTFWKWMALQDGVLFALTGETEQTDETMRWKRKAHGWPWTGISKGYNRPDHSWGFGRNLLAIDPKSQKVLWHHHEDQPIDARALCMNSRRVFAFRFGAYLTCLDAKTGEVLWRKTKDNDPNLFEALGSYLNRQSWQTNWRTAVYLKCSDKALYFAGPQMPKLLAVSTVDGRILWEDPYDNYQLVIHPDAVYAISGPWGKNVSRKLDPLTGDVLAELPTGRRACTRPTGTVDSILYRAMGGSVRFDISGNQPRWLSPMRPPCFDGVTIANGLLYWSPFVCDCQLSLNGFVSVGAAGGFDFQPSTPISDRLETTDARLAPSPAAPSPADWPTFRGNNQRTARTLASLPKAAQLLWQTDAPTGKDTRLTAPVVANGLAYVGGSDGTLRAHSALSGDPVWCRYTGGEIRIPPTIANGRAFVGSGDGYVYAFEASSGKLLWRFRAAPKERKIPVFGKLLSTWPAASGVLVENGVAYVAAGLSNYDGTYVYALDVATGKPVWCNDTSGHLDPNANCGASVQGHLLLNDGKLYLAGGNAVSPAVYDIRDGKCLNDPAPLADCQSTSPRGWELFLLGDRVIACGAPFYADPDIPVYDHTVTKKLLHTKAGDFDVLWQDNAKLACYKSLDEDSLNKSVTDERIPRHVTQAWGSLKVSKQPLWQTDVPGSRGIAVGSDTLIIADATRVAALTLDSGKELWNRQLPAAPVPWGLAVDAQGRVILSLVDGRVLCMGKP